mgnify:CR=1 FL=1
MRTEKKFARALIREFGRVSLNECPRVCKTVLYIKNSSGDNAINRCKIL